MHDILYISYIVYILLSICNCSIMHVDCKVLINHYIIILGEAKLLYVICVCTHIVKMYSDLLQEPPPSGISIRRSWSIDVITSLRVDCVTIDGR